MDSFLATATQVISQFKETVAAEKAEKKVESWETRKIQEQQKWIDRYQNLYNGKTPIPFSQLRAYESLYPNYYAHCLDVLENAQFSVLSYEEKERNANKNEWQNSNYIIKFICVQKGWICHCGLKESVDIEEGMFQLRHLYHLESGRYLDFYCDMFGHNTGLARFHRALKMIENGWDNYIEQTYNYYLKLPQLLTEKGFVTELEKIQYDLESPYVRLKVTIPIDQQVKTQINYCKTKKSSFDSVYSRLERKRIQTAIENHTYYLIVLEAYHSGFGGWEDISDNQTMNKTEDWFGVEKFFITNNKN